MRKIMKTCTASQSLIVENDDDQNIIGFDKPYKPGDYISISTPQVTLFGRVLTIGLGYTELRSNWGSIIMIPDFIMSRAAITNFTEDKYLQTSITGTVEKNKVAEAL